MTSQELRDLLAELKGDAKEYIELRIDALKLRLADNLSIIINKVLTTVIVIALFLIGLVFLASGFNRWLGTRITDMGAGVVTCAFFVICGLIVFKFRKTLFVNSLVETFVKTLFEKPEELDQNDKKNE